ncbi:hypothetical protein A2392_01820 [Candidatus Kaiserbacteria bacterium RIFOXYB1_FULL_46_14]|uniref:SCP domain-containing protein n=1 Tax=Candidatus Kaiserbacteria bacterium RIFOXYB1_FULL_46_14 TaxID=1798531 RepID=A0A1F6FJY6_9BACT|nr:MAG: hypothetical protein A2392_01820 [Candidatus Kaiserbacteria bacterium RIFOXYB1_FULL_46_14]
MIKTTWKKYLVPDQENDFQPHSLQKAAMVGMLILTLITFSLVNLQSILWLASEYLVAAVLPAVVIEETNASRAREQLPTLGRSAELDEAARLKAENMAAEGYFSHWSPEGVSPWHWFEEVGYNYTHAGENLAVHFTDSTAVVEAWLNSPSHRANILNEHYTEMGIGTAAGKFEGYDTVFVVQLFGAPAVAIPVEEPVDILGFTAEASSSDDVAAAGSPTVAGVENIDMTESGTVVIESFATTSNEMAVAAVVTPSGVMKLATSPRLVLQIIYSMIGLFVMGALLIAMLLEWRRHHPVQIAYSAALLAVMIMLFQIHLVLSGSVVIA